MFKRKFLSLFLALVLVVSITVPAFAANVSPSKKVVESANQLITMNDTTDILHKDYVDLATNHYRTSDDATTVQAICELFISSVYANRRNPSYDYSFFLSDHAENNATIAYLNSQNQYQREVSAVCNYNTVSDSMSFENFTATIRDNICDATIQMHYTYDITGEFNDTCYLNCEYYLTLSKDSGQWKISSVRSSLPTENSRGFVYRAFDVADAVTAVTQETFSRNDLEQNKTTNSTRGVVVPELYTDVITAYYPDMAVSYASQYYNTTNPLFGFSDRVNCQNFVSQCVWAGLKTGCGSEGLTSTVIPAVSTTRVGSDAPNVWCRNQYTTYYSHYTNNWAWDNVNGFIRLIDASNYSQQGPQGTYSLGLDNVKTGDAITWDTSGQHDYTTGSYDHTMFVTSVSGSLGSRGVGNVYIAANTDPTTSAYMPLTQYCSYPESYFCTLHIDAGYYYLKVSP